jgi:hypothetical protein
MPIEARKAYSRPDRPRYFALRPVARKEKRASTAWRAVDIQTPLKGDALNITLKRGSVKFHYISFAKTGLPRKLQGKRETRRGGEPGHANQPKRPVM